MPELLIYIPAFNSEKTIVSVLERIPKSIFETSEILIVDNSSTDQTVKRIKDYIQTTSTHRIHLLQNPFNKGYGGSQKEAYSWALEHKFTYVCMLHSDGQYAPEKLPEMLKTIRETKAAMVFGSRMKGSPLKGGMPLYRYIANRGLTIIENMFLGTRLSEFHSGYRIYSCEFLNRIPFLRNTNNFHFDSEIIFQIIQRNFPIGEVTIPTHYGTESSSVSFLGCLRYGTSILVSLLDFKLNQAGLKKTPRYQLESR